MYRIVTFAGLLLLLGLSLVAINADASVVRDTTIYAIQRGDITLGDSVRVRDVVVTGVDINPTTYGFWAQEQPGGPYSGILCYSGSTYPTGINIGDVLKVKGVYAEYYGLSEINSYYSHYWEYLGTTTPPTPVLLSCKDLGYVLADTTAEKWEGVLVQLDTLVVVRDTVGGFASSYLVIEAHDHSPSTNLDSVYVRNDKMDPSAPTGAVEGDTLLSITGVLSYEWDNYRLCPRNGDDIVALNAPPPHLLRAYATSNTSMEAVFDRKLQESSAETIGNYSLGTETAITGASLDPIGEQVVTLTTATQIPGEIEELTAGNIRSKEGTLMQSAESEGFRAGICTISMVQTPVSEESDASQFENEEVTVAGIVTGDKTAFITQFYIEQSGGGPWSGIQIYGGIPTTVAEGDSVIVAGFADEYYGKTEITSVDYLRVASSGNTIPGPDLVDPSQINTGSATAESYEGVFVRCDPVFVADTVGFEAFGEWRVSDLTPDVVMVGHTGQYDYIPTVGKWMNICGPIDYVFDNYRIEPRRDSDIDTLNVIGVEPTTPAPPAVFVLEQNFPNPFNPMTTIVFSLPAKGEAKLGIYDVSGRLVRTLQDGVLEAGKHTVTWNGRNDGGREVSSGVYFCKLIAANRIAETKLVLLK